MNLCMPGDGKSCAACCGLFNVRDGTRPALSQKLEQRTRIFRNTDRTPDALLEFEDATRGAEADRPLDQEIHVCAFTGFVDPNMRTPGCMLHPSAPGNRDIDLRGLCHYGSIACKMFYCPAWDELNAAHREVVIRAIDDWHLYGLVITDVTFVRSLFGVLEKGVGDHLDPARLCQGRAFDVFKEMLAWKDTWPLRGASRVRMSRYYLKGEAGTSDLGFEAHVDLILECLKATFNLVPMCFQTGDMADQRAGNLVRFGRRKAVESLRSRDPQPTAAPNLLVRKPIRITGRVDRGREIIVRTVERCVEAYGAARRN